MIKEDSNTNTKDFLPFTTLRSRCNRCKIILLQALETAIAVALFITFLTVFDLSKQDRKVSNTSKNPTLVWYTEHDDVSRMFFIPENVQIINCSSGSKTIQCDVTGASQYPKPAEGYLFYGTFIRSLPSPRGPKTLWGLLHEESPRNIVDLMHEQALSLFNFTSTFSRYSDVPLPLYWMRSVAEITDLQYFVNTSTKNTFLSELAPVLYMQTNCDTLTERDDYVKKLMECIPIDSYGRCLKNKNLSEDFQHFGQGRNRHYITHLHNTEILHFIARYKFIIAIENAVCKDYATEKFWRSIHTGVVPIYYGDPQIRDWLPNAKSAILLQDFPTPELMSQHLHELLRNDTKYEEYLEHKTKALISNRRIFEEIQARPTQTDMFENIHNLSCFLCERLHDKNDSRVNVANKNHYDCPIPTSALTLSVNPENPWLKRIQQAKSRVENFVMHLSSQGSAHKQDVHALSEE